MVVWKERLLSNETREQNYKGMYDHSVTQIRVQIPSLNPPPNPFEHAIYGAGSDLIRSELGAYGEKIMESSSEYLQTNMDKFFSDPQYYFQVNDHYVKNKLKVILLPFLHKGHWSRIAESVEGRILYKPPIYDINAPDLYIPLMAFGTYLVLAGLSLGLQGKFSPEALNAQFTKGLVAWFLQVMILEAILHLLGSGEVPLLDMVAYGGYAFAGVSLAMLARILWSYSYYVVITWECLCMGVFLVKILKRILFTEMRSFEKHSSQRHYLLLSVAIVQIPLLFWVSGVCG